MPVVWLKHDRRQLFINVAILTAEQAEGAQKGVLPVQPQMFRALIDTGAMGTCITAATAQKLGLQPIGKVPIQGVSGTKYHNNYLFYVGFTINLGPAGETTPDGQPIFNQELHVLPTAIQGAEFDAGQARFDVLLGMDVIAVGNLTVGQGVYSWAW
jgi:hypothetical protein